MTSSDSECTSFWVTNRSFLLIHENDDLFFHDNYFENLYQDLFHFTPERIQIYNLA